MAKTADLTLEILKQIRDNVAETNVRIDTLGDRLDARIDHLGDRLDARIDKLDGTVRQLADRQTESELRLATEIVALSHAVGGVRDLLREHLDERKRVDDHERRIRELERKSA